MSSVYTIEYNFVAKTTVAVEANDEGEALAKGREIVEDTDISMFILGEEMNAHVINTQNLNE